MYRIILFLSILTLIPLNTFGGGSKPPAIPPLSISVSTKDVFYVNQKIKFSAAGGTTPYTFSANIGSINKTTGDYIAPASAGQASVKVTDKKGNTATYNAPVYFYLSINPTSSSVPTSSNYSFSGSGGLGPYKYSTTKGTVGVSNGVFSAPTSPGSAVITVTDSRNNKANSNVTIYQSLGITPTTNLIMVNKTFTFRGTGGMGSYTYSTDKGSIASTGVYTAPGTTGNAVVSVTDSRNAKATAAVTIYPALIINPISLTMVVNKSSTFTASGGYGTRSFSTNNGTIGASSGIFVAPPVAGSAVVTVTDSLGNKATANVTINADLSISPTNLFLAINKPANFSGFGGIAPLSFSSTYGSINSSSGAYTAPAAGGLGTITVTDNSNPKLSKSASVCVFAPLKVFPTEKIIVVGGSLVISAIDGCAPYEYTADIGTISTNKNVNNNTGNYKAPNTEGNAKITIKDAAGNTVVANIRINTALAMEPLPLTLPINGIYNVRPSAGVPPYIFKVTNGIGTIDPTGKYTAPGTEGTANITVTDSDGMVRSGQICVYEPLKISPAEKSLVINSTLSFSATHGCKPYKFSTNNGSINIDSGFYTAPGLAGLGTVTVTDLANKNSVANLTIYPPISLNPLLGKLQTGKTLKFTAKGGVPELKWESTIGNITLSQGNINPLSVEGITDITTIITYTAPNNPGIANIKVTDSMSFNQTAILEIYAPLVVTPVDKTLMVNDKFTFSVSGGVPPYTFESNFIGGGIVTAGNLGNFTAPENAGVGKVTVKDSDGNQVSANVTIKPALAISPTFANLEVNQVLPFVASGGIGPYTFISSMFRRDFDLDGNFRPIKSGLATITLQDSAGHEVTAIVKVYDPLEIIPQDKVLAVGDSFDRFTARGGIPGYGFSQNIGMVDPVSGIYTSPLGGPGTGFVEVRDSIGNSKRAQITINPALALVSEKENVEVGKTSKFTASGGIGILTFSTDGRGQIDSNGNYIAPSTSGPATITVVDSVGHSKSVTINIYDPLNISPPQKVLVLDDSFQFNISGGVLPYTVTAITGQVVFLGYYTARQVGADTITVVDSIGNTVTAALTINAKLAVSPTTANLEVNKVLHFVVTGGIGPYRYGSSMDARDFDLNGNFRPIKSGTATLTFTDSTGRFVNAIVKVYDPLNISPTSKDLAVGNSFPFLITGGALPYKVIADRGTINEFGNYTAPSEVGNGTDKITVTDIENNVVTANLNIKAGLKIDPASAILAVNRTIIFKAVDGVGPYTFSVNNVGTVGLTTGSYQAPAASGAAEVTVRDSLGNTATAAVTINEDLDINPKDIKLAFGKTGNFSASGGVGDRRFSALRGQIDPVTGTYIAPQSIGEDTVTVTDGGGFTKTAKVTVYETLKISPTIKDLAVNDPFKFTITGGFPNLSVIADRGTINVNGDYVAPGEVGNGEDKITVTDSDNNQVSAKVTINAALSITPITANLEVLKKLNFTVSGGIGPYTYESSIGNITTSNTTGFYTAPATKGTATITVTDNVGHKITAEVNVYDPLKITPTQKDLAVGDSVDFVIEGGFGSYSIVPVAGSIDVNRKYTAITAGSGSVTVTDSANNTVVANLTISPALSLDPTVAKVEVGKTLKFNASGGVGALTFSAAAGRGTIDPSGNYLAPATIGPDTVTVKDTANHSLTAEVTVYDTLRISPEQKDLAVNNTFNFIITGGFGPYTIAKADRGSFNANGNYTAPDSAGVDKITVTDSDNNTVFATLNIKPALKIDPSSATLAVNRTKTFKGIDGVGPYTFSVNNVGTVGLTTGSYQAPAAPGTAEVTVTDSLLNTATAIVTINPELVIDPENINLAVNGNKKFNATGGVGDLIFSISNGTGNIVLDGTYTAPSTKGLVQVTVTDSEGFFKTANVNVYLLLKISPEEKILAVGNKFDFNAVEGVPPYVFSVDSNIGSITTNNLLVINAGLASLTAAGSDLPAVGYVTLRDTANPDNQVKAKVTVNAPLSLDPKPAFLAINGTYDFKASTKGGAPDYTYSADNGSFNNGIYTASGTSGSALITVRDSMGGEATASLCIYAPLEFDPDENKILAVGNSFTFKAKEGCKPYKFAASIGSIGTDSGTFSSSITGSGQITVTDATNVNTAHINVTITPPLSLEPALANLEVGKNKDFTASGGVSPYEFSLVTATGMGTINSGGSIVNYVAPMTAGSNTVRVTDSFGNTKDAAITIYSSLAISPSVKQEIEAGKPAISFTASGGVSPYTFILTNPVGTISSSGAVASFNPGAAKGVTKVILTDKENNTKEVDIEVYLALILSPASNQTIGKNDKINFTASEGRPGYTWSVSPSSASLVVSADKITAEFSAPNITQLTSYVVTVVDSGGTSRSANVTVSLPLIISPKTLSIAAKGSSSFSATGGYEPYKFTTNIGAIDLNSGAFNALNNSGTGKVIVTDAAGLTDFANVTVIPGLTIMPTQASVGVNGSYDFILTGGIPPYRSGADIGSTSDHTGGFTYMATGAAGEAVVNAVDSSTPPNQVFASVKIYAGLGIDPPFRTLGLNETATFKGTGGVPNYVFSVPVEGGTITTDPAGDGGKGVGNYVFSKMILMDTVTVRDNAGATAQAFINGNFPSLFIWAYGSDAFNFPGGQGANAGFPGSRAICANWADSNGNLWFFGGLGLAPSSARIILYYFSRYDTKDNTWHTYEATQRNAGKYGTKGVADIGNFAGARYGAVTWTTDGGKSLWLFGGHGYADANNALGELNDLWKIDVSKPEANLPRTWVSGADKINQQGNYGNGVLCPSGLATGAPPSPTSVPGARSKAVSWLDPQGNFWLFGGKGYDCAGTLGYLNDLWKFTVSTKEWTWIGGSNKVNSPGQFTNGTDGTYANPGAREGAVSWVDVNGDFWLFGGSSSATTFLNGLWKYNRTTNRWAFVKGSTVANQLGVYGNKAEGYPLNNPGSRDGAISFADSKGNLFLFGGYGYAESGGIGFLNDYWRFNTLDGSNNWIWEGGDKTINGLGSHGEIGVASPNSWPGARSYPAFWKDSNGKFWFFGGSRTRNIEDALTGDFYNDMWKFFPK